MCRYLLIDVENVNYNLRVNRHHRSVFFIREITVATVISRMTGTTAFHQHSLGRATGLRYEHCEFCLCTLGLLAQKFMNSKSRRNTVRIINLENVTIFEFFNKSINIETSGKRQLQYLNAAKCVDYNENNVSITLRRLRPCLYTFKCLHWRKQKKCRSEIALVIMSICMYLCFYVSYCIVVVSMW